MIKGATISPFLYNMAGGPHPREILCSPIFKTNEDLLLLQRAALAAWHNLNEQKLADVITDILIRYIYYLDDKEAEGLDDQKVKDLIMQRSSLQVTITLNPKRHIYFHHLKLRQPHECVLTMNREKERFWMFEENTVGKKIPKEEPILIESSVEIIQCKMIGAIYNLVCTLGDSVTKWDSDLTIITTGLATLLKKMQ